MGQIELTLFFCDDKPNETGRIIICVHKQLSTLFCSNNNQPENCVFVLHRTLFYCFVRVAIKLAVFFYQAGARATSPCVSEFYASVCVCVRSVESRALYAKHAVASNYLF